jgi:hypothetical protein
MLKRLKRMERLSPMRRYTVDVSDLVQHSGRR